MGLIWFHRFLIACGIIFCFGFAIWEARAFSVDGAASKMVLAVVFGIFGIALVVYLRNLRRVLKLPADQG